MKALRNYLDKIKPNFEEGGKFHAFQSVFDGFETFLFVPSKTAKTGTQEPKCRRRQSLKLRRNIIIGSSITKLPRRSSA